MHRLIRLGGLMPLASVLLIVGGCAGLGVRTEGTSGPIAWRVSDLAVVTRDIRGQPIEGQAFTFVIKNITTEL